MSSTDPAADAISRFYKQRLLPAAEKIRERGVDPLSRNTSGSSFQPPSPGTDLTEITQAELVSELEQRWRADGLPELASLAGELVTLAEIVKETNKDGDGEVSPLVYVMY